MGFKDVVLMKRSPENSINLFVKTGLKLLSVVCLPFSINSIKHFRKAF